MAESTLSISLSDLQTEVGRFLGYDVDPAQWSDAVAGEVDRVIQSGIRQFYYPPAVEGVDPGYEWSFLKPVAELTTADGDVAQDMPDNFGRIVGDLHFDASVYAQSITIISEHRILALLQQNDDEGRPRHAALRFKESDGTNGQRQEIVWWPTPDAAYTLTYRYEAFAGKLTESNAYPLGGMRYAELIIESCLAVAEQRANDERGLHWEAFTRLLVTAVAQDRKNGARYFGAMSQGETVESDARCRRLNGSSYDITYKGETW
jgi:hypothetical protein